MYSECTPNVLRLYSDCKPVTKANDSWRQLTSASGQQLAAPGSKSRREILRIFLECCAELLYVSAVSRSRQEAIPIKHAGVFSESSIARMQEAMIMRRLKVYSYERRIPKPPPRLSFCGRCFAHMVLNGGNPPPRPQVFLAVVPWMSMPPFSILSDDRRMGWRFVKPGCAVVSHRKNTTKQSHHTSICILTCLCMSKRCFSVLR